MRLRRIMALVCAGVLVAACAAVVKDEAGGVNAARASAPAPEPLPAHTAGPPTVDVGRNSDVPALPFEDNFDPSLCGIPQRWTRKEPAYLTGVYEGQLIQPAVLLYDSHLRREVVGQAPHGARVQILLSQSNPTLDYFFVKILDTETPIEGWVPAPFVSFEPPVGPA